MAEAKSKPQTKAQEKSKAPPETLTLRQRLVNGVLVQTYEGGDCEDSKEMKAALDRGANKDGGKRGT